MDVEVVAADVLATAVADADAPGLVSDFPWLVVETSVIKSLLWYWIITPNALIPSPTRSSVCVVPLPCRFVVVTVINRFDVISEAHASPVYQTFPIVQV
jgi:hypothetical protein